jgi:hypothetical protein
MWTSYSDCLKPSNMEYETTNKSFVTWSLIHVLCDTGRHVYSRNSGTYSSVRNLGTHPHHSGTCSCMCNSGTWPDFVQLRHISIFVNLGTYSYAQADIYMCATPSHPFVYVLFCCVQLRRLPMIVLLKHIFCGCVTLAILWLNSYLSNSSTHQYCWQLRHISLCETARILCNCTHYYSYLYSSAPYFCFVQPKHKFMGFCSSDTSWYDYISGMFCFCCSVQARIHMCTTHLFCCTTHAHIHICATPARIHAAATQEHIWICASQARPDMLCNWGTHVYLCNLSLDRICAA